MDYFQKFFDNSGYIYSLDMIRLALDFGNSSQKVVNFLDLLRDSAIDVTVDYYSSFHPFRYRHLWTISLVDTACSFTVGLNIGNNPNIGFIEYNPNKCERYQRFVELRNKIMVYAFEANLVRYDCAIDIPLRRENCKLVRERGKNYEYFIKLDGVTEYLGRRNSNGFIKLYDKTEESKLDYDLTRLELTLDAKTDPLKIFPTVLLYDEQYQMILDDTLSSTQIVLIELLRQCENPSQYLNRLHKDVKKKIAPYLADKVLSPDINCLLSVRKLALSYTK